MATRFHSISLQDGSTCGAQRSEQRTSVSGSAASASDGYSREKGDKEVSKSFFSREKGDEEVNKSFLRGRRVMRR